MILNNFIHSTFFLTANVFTYLGAIRNSRKAAQGLLRTRVSWGAITKKKNRKIWGKFPKGRRGVEKNRRKLPISIWEFEKPRGGGLNFSKMSEFQLFCNYFAILPL